MANLRADNLTGTGGRNAIDGSVFFGNTSDSGGDYLELADTADLEFGSGDYTVEFWALFKKTASSNSYEEIVNKGYPFQIYRNAYNNQVLLAVDSNTTSYDINTSFGTAERDTWHHIAVSRSGNTTKAFLNGVEGLSSTSSTSIYDSSSKFSIGRYSDSTGYKFWGYVSNLRVIKGTALYTASFTPPTEKLTAVAGTVLLCCQDSMNPEQEATGKTITGYGDLTVSDGVDLVTGTWTDVSSGSASASGSGKYVSVVGTDLSNRGAAYMPCTVVVGKKYEFGFRCVAGITNSKIGVDSNDGTSDVRDAVGNNPDLAYTNSADSTVVAGRKYRNTFTATTTTADIYFQGVNGTVTADEIFLRLLESPKAPKVLPPVGVDEGVTFSGDTKVNSKNYMYFPTGDTSQRGRGRAVVFGGANNVPNYLSSISYYNISNFSSAHDFGDMGAGGGWMTACSSSTRGLAIGAANGGGATNVVEYVEIATTGNAKDFGDLTEEKNYFGAASNQTRALRAGGYTVGTDTIDYATIATTGDFADFGNLTQGRLTHEGGVNSPTRAIWGGGTFYDPSVVYHNIIDYITIATTGNATDFGDMTVSRKAMAAVCSSTRGIWSGGYTPTYQNVKDYITIATTGNAADFGDSLWSGAYKSGTSNGTRGVWTGGRVPGGNAYRSNLIEHVTIATTGDGTDFGDLNVRRDGPGACSDSHGGL